MEKNCNIIEGGNGQRNSQFIYSSNQMIKFELIMAETIFKTYTFRLKPSKRQSQKLKNTLCLCKDLYNAALQERRDAYHLNRISINYQSQQNQLPAIKQTNPEYKEIYSQVLQNVLKRLDLAFQGFFARIKRKEKAGFPRFRSLNRYDSFTFPQSGFSLKGNKLMLSKIGTLKLKLSRQVTGKIKTLSIKNECGRWLAIFTVETKAKPLPKTNQAVGIDAGISSFLTLSNSTVIKNPRLYESLQKQLRVVNRSISRKKKGGNNRKRVVLKLRKIHQKIKNCRADYHHKTARYLVNNFDFIAIEKLKVFNLLKNHKLAKNISDVGWSNFFSILNAKAVEAGRTIKEVNPAYTSQKCSNCGAIVKKDLSERTHNCSCGLSLGRDENAARNILALGLSALDVTYSVS